ncbi:MAG: GcrA family cell cycle regulator, partial [Xanthobacteraceae bacterium]
MLNTAATIIPDPACAPARAPAGSPANSPWTAERIEQLRNGVSSGLTCRQIAAEIGVTRNAVIGKSHRLGLSPGRPAA